MSELLLKCFLLSLLLHVIDDFVLQPICLSKLKQKKFWIEHEDYKDKYKDDYKMALFIHCLSWTIITFLPLIFVLKGILFYCLISLMPLNLMTHYITDDAKANEFKINLIQDQLIHIGQIIFSYLIIWFCYKETVYLQ